MTIKLLITIVTRGLLQEVEAVLHRHDLAASFATLGHGTASNEIRYLLGLGTTEKDVVLSLAPQHKLDRVIPTLAAHLHLAKAGHGIAFAIELNNINASALTALTADAPQNADKEDSTMQKETTHELILAVVDGDQSDLAFAAAKEAGCRGGTIIKGREVDTLHARKIFHINVQPERELLMILVPKADTKPILRAIVNAVLKETGEHIMAFSLPVSDVMGLSNLDLMDNTLPEEK